MFKQTLLGAVVAAGSLISLVPTAANAQYTAIVATAPPPPLQEAIPADRPGYVWSPGHYQWRGNQYVWVRGHWLVDRAGYEYQEPRWVQRGNGEWVLVGGDWIPERHARNNGRYGDPDFQRGGGRRHLRYPTPRADPRYSPTTAPTKARPTEVCRLENTQLVALGR